jgi:hypothetical protein
LGPASFVRNVQHKGKTWRIKNNFFWLTNQEAISILRNAPNAARILADAREEKEDSYLATILPTLSLSPGAQLCLNILRNIWVQTLPERAAFVDERSSEKEGCHLIAFDAGWYQLKYLAREKVPVLVDNPQQARKALANRLQNGAYDHGFLLR